MVLLKMPEYNAPSIRMAIRTRESGGNTIICHGKINRVTYKRTIFIAVICGSLFSGVNAGPEVSTGPTIHLTDGPSAILNPASNLMYFVPLVSPTLVESLCSEDNRQVAKILSLQRNFKKKDFRLVCEFDLQGSGSFTNTYEPNSMIEYWIPINKPGKTMTNMLDFIKLEGTGFGSVEVTGKTVQGRREVTTVRVHFNARGAKSPVSIGLYNLIPQDGQYDYANRSNRIIARVNNLTFRKTNPDTKPTMLVEVASIVDADEKEGFWGNVKGALANLFIPPVVVDKEGNDAMIQFGTALVNGNASFTFPKAKNLIERPAIAENDRVSAKATVLAPELGS